MGGSRRTKEGKGVVESGSEKIVVVANPWDALGYQAIEEAVSVFNKGGYAAAAALLDGAVKNADEPSLKRELATLKAVMDGYAAWDRFNHKTAKGKFDDALKNQNDLTSIFKHHVEEWICQVKNHRTHIEKLVDQTEATRAWVQDLLHNARRRAEEDRYDDACPSISRLRSAGADTT